MSKPTIHGITISVDFSDKDYGKGQTGFMNLQAKYPEPGQPLDALLDVVEDGLDMYFTAWRTMMAGRFATGQIPADEFKDTFAKVTLRLDKVKNFLRNYESNEQ